MNFTIFSSGKQQVPGETYYPNKHEVTDEQSAIAAFTSDHVCAEYVNNHRSNNDFIKSDVICLDCDNSHTEDPDLWVDEKDYETMFSGINYVLVPSRSHMKAKDGKVARPRHHIYFPIDTVTDAGKYKALKEEICKSFSFFDTNALDAAHFFFGHNVNSVVWHEDGFNIDAVYGTSNTKRVVSQGGRNKHMSSFAGRILVRLGDTDEAYEGFLEEAQNCDPPLDDIELEKIWKSAMNFYKAQVLNNPNYVPPENYNPDGLKPGDYSDIGQATVIARELDRELRFTIATDYLVYNGVLWEESLQKSVGATESFLNIQLAEARAKVKKAKAKLLENGVPGEKIAKGGAALVAATNGSPACMEYLDALEYQKFVLKRRDMKYVISALQAAKPMLEISPNDLDRNAYLLNCPDGTYDLKQGVSGFKEHDPKDYITKVTNYAPGDEGEYLWDETLNTIFQGDAELVEYVQNIVGMAAVGEVNMEAIIISYGDGSNGKSTFWNTIAAVLGDYSGKISAATLTLGNRNNPKNELAETKGKRLLIASELKEGTRLDTAMVKQLCSTDEIFAEKKYKDPFTFTPSHTLVLYTNHLPKVGATDEGIWRRLIVVPFTATIKGKNKNFANVLLKKAAPYIMTWIIEGARKVIKNDFNPKTPRCVLDAINEYREDNDWMGHFMNECCEIGATFEEKSSRLFSAYLDYSASVNEYRRSQQEFTRELENRGCTRKKKNDGNYIIGVHLTDEYKGFA